jgi:hypothetical protein
MNIFNAKFPNLTITRCVDYDQFHFVIEAVENVNVANYNDPYYSVDKRSGKITSFIPTLDLDAFFEAVENRTVYSTY